MVFVVAARADLCAASGTGCGFARAGARGVLDVFWGDPGAAVLGGAVETVCGCVFGVFLVPFEFELLVEEGVDVVERDVG